MKKTLLIVLPLLLMMAGCSKTINESTLIKRGEHMYEPNATKPFSGKVFELYENGQKMFEGSYKDGFKHGDWTYFTEVVSGKYEVTYTVGVYHLAVFTDNMGTTYTGSPITKESEKDGTYFFQDMSDEYDFSKFPDGFAMVTYGKRDGPYTSWYENGQKKEEGTYKSDDKDGPWTFWYENGQKKEESAYKNGLIQGLGLHFTESGEIKYEVKEPVTDIDGNSYKTIRIGNQVWMAENLKVTHYRNGDAIPTGLSNSDWSNLSTGAYAVYDGDESNVATYGYLYNWYAVDDSRNIAPEGWHVPTDEEWTTLIDYLGGNSVAGGKMKETGTAHWESPNTGVTNESGFTALPGGYRYGGNGYYGYMGSYGYYWSSTESSSNHAWYRYLHYYTSEVYRDFNNKKSGFSVRCVRD
tara:strand:- start:15 stop:1244 length:1230 start_codon:yes stop_codon:yes gene_type:complete